MREKRRTLGIIGILEVFIFSAVTDMDFFCFGFFSSDVFLIVFDSSHYFSCLRFSKEMYKVI